MGRIGKPFGLKGEAVLHYYGDGPERFAPGSRVFVVTPAGRVAATVSAWREMPRKLVGAFVGRESIEAITPWVGCEVEVPARELPELESGRYYHFQLVGLQVFAADGRGIGVVREVLGTGGNDVLSVRDGDREILIPLIEDAVARVDLPAGRLVLKDLEGLLQP